VGIIDEEKVKVDKEKVKNVVDEVLLLNTQQSKIPRAEYEKMLKKWDLSDEEQKAAIAQLKENKVEIVEMGDLVTSSDKKIETFPNLSTVLYFGANL